jgi:hypothetical protein
MECAGEASGQQSSRGRNIRTTAKRASSDLVDETSTEGYSSEDASSDGYETEEIVPVKRWVPLTHGEP